MGLELCLRFWSSQFWMILSLCTPKSTAVSSCKEILHLICKELRKAMKAKLGQSSLFPKQNAPKAIDFIWKWTYGCCSQPDRKGRLSVFKWFKNCFANTIFKIPCHVSKKVKCQPVLPIESYTAPYSWNKLIALQN